MDGHDDLNADELERGLVTVSQVRDLLGVPWRELMLSPDGVIATFNIGPDALATVAIQRRDLLSNYLSSIVEERGARIEGRKRHAERAADFSIAVRAWSQSVTRRLTDGDEPAGSATGD